MGGMYVRMSQKSGIHCQHVRPLSYTGAVTACLIQMSLQDKHGPERSLAALVT